MVPLTDFVCWCVCVGLHFLLIYMLPLGYCCSVIKSIKSLVPKELDGTEVWVCEGVCVCAYGDQR